MHGIVHREISDTTACRKERGIRFAATTLLFSDHEKAEWKRRYATQQSPSISKRFLVAGLLSKLNGRNSNLLVATIQQPFLFGRLPTEELACRKKQDYTEKGDQHPPCVCFWNRRNGRIVIFALPILIAVVLAVVALAVVRARER